MADPGSHSCYLVLCYTTLKRRENTGNNKLRYKREGTKKLEETLICYHRKTLREKPHGGPHNGRVEMGLGGHLIQKDFLKSFHFFKKNFLLALMSLTRSLSLTKHASVSRLVFGFVERSFSNAQQQAHKQTKICRRNGEANASKGCVRSPPRRRSSLLR